MGGIPAGIMGPWSGGGGAQRNRIVHKPLACRDERSCRRDAFESRNPQHGLPLKNKE